MAIDDDLTQRSVSGRQRIVLAVIVAVGLGLRLGYLLHAVHSPGYVWEDPDKYMVQALKLARHGAGWRWSFDAVTYTINWQQHALPPGYSVFLSLFALFPGFPLSAQIAQVLLGILTIGLVFTLGRQLHSTRAGLIAAAGYALWVPSIFNVWSTSQETVYLPVLLFAFVVLGRAIDRDANALQFLVAGLAFGIAALTRSMPLFFIVPAGAVHVALASNRRRATLQATALAAGFFSIVVPYSAALSRHFGQLTVIDTHGSIHFESVPGSRAPTMIETAAGLWRAFAAHPLEYLDECVARARSLLHVNGGRVLQTYVVADTKLGAAVWKALVHGGADLLLVTAALLAGIGAALCKRPRIAAMFVLWTIVNMTIASLGGFGGARLRAPFEPVMIVLAAVIPAGGWRRPRLVSLAAGILVGILIAVAVLPQVPQSLRAWPDYGVAWPSIFSRQSGRFIGTAGLNVPAYNGIASVTAAVGGSGPVEVHVRAGAVPLQTVQIAAGQAQTIRILWPRRGLAFIELDAVNPDGTAAVVQLTVEQR
jgi:hypothetical protein